jgi:hypothetical protein
MAISDEQWDKNQAMQLTWCADRNNMLAVSHLPAPKDPTGSTLGNWAAPIDMQKGTMRINLAVGINQNRSRLPHFDGQPNWLATVSPAPTVRAGGLAEGGVYPLARDIGRFLCSPDVAIQAASCRLKYDPSLTHPRPWTRGPLQPLDLFHADLTYTTFSHPGHWPAPVILDGSLTLKQDVAFSEEGDGITVLRMTAWSEWSGYDTAMVMHSSTGDYVGRISYAGESVPGSRGAFDPYCYIYFYPSMFGSVGIMSLSPNLRYRYSNKYARIEYDTSGKTLSAGTTLRYRILVFVSAFDEPPCNRLPEALRENLGLSPSGSVTYRVRAETGKVTGTEYLLDIDGTGSGFAGEVRLPKGFPMSLPVRVTNLNENWSSMLYERDARRMRPLGMHGGAAYCHRAPTQRDGRIFIGHPFTVTHEGLVLSVVQTGEAELTVQVHNPADDRIEATLRRTAAFDFLPTPDRELSVPAGSTVTLRLSPDGIREDG